MDFQTVMQQIFGSIINRKLLRKNLTNRLKKAVKAILYRPNIITLYL